MAATDYILALDYGEKRLEWRLPMLWPACAATDTASYRRNAAKRYPQLVDQEGAGLV